MPLVPRGVGRRNGDRWKELGVSCSCIVGSLFLPVTLLHQDVAPSGHWIRQSTLQMIKGLARD